MAYALDTGIGQVNVESERELELLSRLAVARGKRMPSRDPHQSGRRRADPRQDHDRQDREQVRHRHRPGAARASPGRAALPGVEPSRLARPYRLAAHRSGAVPHRPSRRVADCPRACAPPASPIEPSRSRRRPRRPLPGRGQAPRRRAPMPRSCARPWAISAAPGCSSRAAIWSPMPACWSARVIVREGRRDPPLRRRRRRHERPDPPDAVRGLARRSCRCAEPATGAPRQRSTSSARSARPATSSRATAALPPVGAGRSARVPRRRRLWRGHGVDLQHAGRWCRSAGQRRRLGGRPAATELRRADRARPACRTG